MAPKMCLIWSEPGSKITQISARGAVTEDEVTICVHGVFPLHMGMERGRKDVSERVYRLGRGT